MLWWIGVACHPGVSDSGAGAPVGESAIETGLWETGSASTSGPTGETGAPGQVDAPRFEVAPSSFDVEIGGDVVFGGVFRDGAPVAFHQEVERRGACRLLRYTPSFCDPACDASEAMCIAGVCEPVPSVLDRGSVQLSWPGGSAEVSPSSGLYYFREPADGPGEVRLAVDDLALSVHTPRPAPWLRDAADRFEERQDEVVLTWEDVEEDARIYLRMQDCVGSHGGLSKHEIECEAADVGELRIPARYADRLAEGDWSRGNCGVHTFERRRAHQVGDVRITAVGWGSLYWWPGYGATSY